MATPRLSIMVFQSTLPVWGVTMQEMVLIWVALFQPTLPVWGVTAPQGAERPVGDISTHTPRVGGDCCTARP